MSSDKLLLTPVFPHYFNENQNKGFGKSLNLRTVFTADWIPFEISTFSISAAGLNRLCETFLLSVFGSDC